MLLWGDGTRTAGSDVLLRILEGLLARNVVCAGDAARRQDVLESVLAPGFAHALRDAVPHVVLAELSRQPERRNSLRTGHMTRTR